MANPSKYGSINPSMLNGQRPSEQKYATHQPMARPMESHTAPVQYGNSLADYHQGQEDHYFKGYRQEEPVYDENPMIGVEAAAARERAEAMRYQGHASSSRQRGASPPPRPQQQHQAGPMRAPSPQARAAAQGPRPQQVRPPPPQQYASDNKYNVANLTSIPRKPVPSPDPKIGPTAPKDLRSVSAESLHLPAPTQHHEQPAEGASQYITLNADGKFDTSTISPGSPRQTSFQESRPSSSSTFARPELTRTSSNRSTSSITNGLKNLGARIRRNSNEFFGNVAKAVDLATARPVERKKYEAVKAAEERDRVRKGSNEREKWHQKQRPEARPRHEQAALKRKNSANWAAKHEGDEHQLNPYEDDISDTSRAAVQQARIDERNAPYKRAERESRMMDLDADANGYRPRTSESDSTFESSNSLTSSERYSAREEYNFPHPKVDSGLDGFDKTGIAIGKMLDPVRRKRSEDSDFMGDAAPEGMMEDCRACGRQPKGCLKGGVCEGCRKKSDQSASMSLFTDPWQPSGRSTWPETNNGVEHGYMTLPGKRKMIKIRQTIYEDPGNPFQDELDAERAARRESDEDSKYKPLPPEPDEESPTGRSFFEFDMGYDPFESGDSVEKGMRSLSLDKPLPVAPSEVSPTASSFHFDSFGSDDGSNYGSDAYHAPYAGDNPFAATHPSSPAEAPRRNPHRSMSVAVPSSPPPSTDEYVSPRRSWPRKNSLPLMNEGIEVKDMEPSARTPQSARDTRWYGFYEDLMSDYDKRRSKLR